MQEETPQEQIKINHKDYGDLMMKKKKTRRGGRARHPMLIQNAKMMSNDQDEMRDLAHIKCFKYRDMGHFALKCPTYLEKKNQAILRRQGNKKQYKSKEEKALTKRNCYSCQKKGTHDKFISPR
jgi:hypothetical protein